MKSAGRFVTMMEVLQHYGISTVTLWRWRRDQGFPAPRQVLGRQQMYDLREVEAWELERKLAGHPVGKGRPLARIDPIRSDLTTQIARRISREHDIARVRIDWTDQLTTVRAFPAPYHKMVADRRGAMLSKLKAPPSLEQQAEINRTSLGQVAIARGSTILGALEGLEIGIKGR